MESSTTRENCPRITSGNATIEPTTRRRNQVLAILAEGLPALPSHIIQLNGLLASSPVDLKRISEVIQSDPGLTGQVIHLCNSALFGLRRRIFKVEEAAILMGADRLRTLVFTCYLMDSSSKWLAGARHPGALAPLVHCRDSQRTHRARDQAPNARSGLSERPFARRRQAAAPDGRGRGRQHREHGDSARAGDTRAEREYFGLDHCEVGRWVGTSWEFYPCHIEVFQFHHHPDGRRSTILCSSAWFPSRTISANRKSYRPPEAKRKSLSRQPGHGPVHPQMSSDGGVVRA